MADLHYFAFLPGDWLASEAVTMMTPEQEGAYIRLLCYQWQSSDLPCSIPSDDARLAHLSRLGKRWAKVGALVRAQFEEVPDDPTRLRNVKLWNVFDEASAKHAARVNAGQKGGSAKAKRKQPGSKPVADDKQSGSNATAMLEQSSSIALASKNKSQNQSNKEKGRDESPPVRTLPPAWIAEGVGFWLPTVGAMVPARMRKVLGPVVAVHGWERVFPDLKQWVAERTASGKPRKLDWYAEEASARIAAAKPAMWDFERECLTEYGERITRPVPA